MNAPSLLVTHVTEQNLPYLLVFYRLTNLKTRAGDYGVLAVWSVRQLSRSPNFDSFLHQLPGIRFYEALARRRSSQGSS